MTDRIDQRTASDCLRCCVATVLQRPYESVPDFVAQHDLAWPGALANWAHPRGYHTLRFQSCGDGEMLQSLEGGEGLWVATGPGPRGSNHAVVYQGFQMHYDPHTSRAGILEVTGAIVFIPYPRPKPSLSEVLSRAEDDPPEQVAQRLVAAGVVKAEDAVAAAARIAKRRS